MKSAATLTPPLLDLEEARCQVCGHSTGRVVYEGIDLEFETCRNRFMFVCCDECQNCYLKFRPRLTDIDIIYRDYLTTNKKSAYHPSGLVAKIKTQIFDRRRISPILNHLRPGSNILDIGAGEGRFLKMIQQISRKDSRFFANEIAFHPLDKMRLEERGIVPIESCIENWQTDLRFDVITGIHVIEHVWEPDAVFAWIGAHLKPGGLVYFETPDADAFCARLFKSKWGMTHFPRHINIFNKGGLKHLAEKNGLAVLRQGNTTSAPAWNMSIRNSAGLNALRKHASPFEIFNYSNLLTLSFFTVIDLFLLAARVPTSTQTLVLTRE